MRICSKKSQGLPVRTLVIMIVALAALALGIIIYLSLQSSASSKSGTLVAGTDASVPNNYEQLFGKSNILGCFEDYYENVRQGRPSENELQAGENDICWTPPPIYGKESESVSRAGYASNIYSCPAGQVIGKVVFAQELQDENDAINIFASDENFKTVYKYAQAGPRASNENKEIDISAGTAKHIQFLLTMADSAATQHYAHQFAGIKVKSIECITPEFDLVPMLGISNNIIDNSGAAKNGDATITWGYWTRGKLDTICNTGSDNEIVELRMTNLLTGIKTTEQFAMPQQCGAQAHKTYFLKPGAGGLYKFEVFVDSLRWTDESTGKTGIGFISESNENNNFANGDVISTIYTHTINLDARAAANDLDEARNYDSNSGDFGFPSQCYAGEGTGRAGKYVLIPGDSQVAFSGLKTDKIYGYIAGGIEYSANEFEIYPKPIDAPGNPYEYFFVYPNKYYIELRSDDDFICGWFKDTDNIKNNNAGQNTLRIEVIK